jgi:hypothetical protein
VLWVAVGAVLFTLTDWRQTKHLCLLVPALSVLLAAGTSRLPTPVRAVVRVLLVVAVVRNVVVLAAVAGDFATLAVSTVW